MPTSKKPTAPGPNLFSPELYINRELSMLAFQRRVLEEAADVANPILERIKFLAILDANLEEFFMVRVAGLLAQVDSGSQEVGPDGTNPTAQLAAIRLEFTRLMKDAHRCLDQQLLPALGQSGILLKRFSELDPAQRQSITKYFHQTIFPVLTPLAFDPGRPFPHISNLSLNLAVVIRDKDAVEHFARVKAPDTLPQMVRVPETGKKASDTVTFVWIEEVIAANLGKLFPGMEIVAAYPFHVTRDAELAIKELEAEDLLETIAEGVKQRKFGTVVRLMVTREMPKSILKILVSNLEVDKEDVYKVEGCLSAKRLMQLLSINRPGLKEPPLAPYLAPALGPTSSDFFGTIRNNNILLHHPYESFQPVVELLRRAARDPDVLAIKMVLYRIGRDSPIVKELLEANANGKQVAVLVELKARFDEESNIEWARQLESEGVHVVYGLLGLKIHCKVALVVRREGKSIRRYVHIGSGNYNALTAQQYTDAGLLTTDDEIGEDATDLFNFLTGYSTKRDYKQLLVAPVNLRQRFEALIQREIDHQRAGRQGRIIFKMNALVDPGIIRALYRASQAGVSIDLIVRGVCCLRPGLPGISDNIRVRSIVGRFLEHSRMYSFGNGGSEEVYLGSADLMPRNLDRRVEVLVPLRAPALIRRVHEEILDTCLRDNVKSRKMLADGSYRKVGAAGAVRINAQSYLLLKASQQKAD